jgi:hypothetical protein
MKKCVHEVAIFVSDYGTSDDAWQSARDALDDVRAAAAEELDGWELSGYTITKVEFLEFDAANVHHASAVFDVFIEGVSQEELEDAMT